MKVPNKINDIENLTMVHKQHCAGLKHFPLGRIRQRTSSVALFLHLLLCTLSSWKGIAHNVGKRKQGRKKPLPAQELPSQTQEVTKLEI